MRSACRTPLAVSARSLSGSPGSASAWRQRIRSMTAAAFVSDCGARTFGQPIEQEFLRGAGAGAPRRLGAAIFAVGAEIPRAAIVVETHRQPFGDDARLELLVEHRKRDFDAAKQVASHPVGARQIDVVAAAVREIPDSRMLEK